MSDLQCPVTVVVMRHGESEGILSRSLSSAMPGAALTDRGRAQVEQAARGLIGRRVARVYASPLLRAQQSAAIVARMLDASAVMELPGVLSRALPQAEPGAAVVQRFGDALACLADQHRGETVVVVSHGLAIPDAAIIELDGDSDGWRLRAWPAGID